MMNKSESGRAKRKRKASSSQPVDSRGSDSNDWRVQVIARIRKLIQQVVPDVVEEIKWRKASNPSGVPVWSQDGIICTGETYKDKVKLTFARGAALADPSSLFNAGLDGRTRRAIDIPAPLGPWKKGEIIDEAAFKALIRAAVALNGKVAARSRGKRT